MKYYPVFLNLQGKIAVVVGGGRVAERKAFSLIKAGAFLKIISPVITKTLEKYQKQGLIRHIKRNYRRGDLKGAFIVIAATSSEKINSRVDADSKEASQLVNIVDTPSEGNFIVPSIVRRGPLTLAISTEGSSPALSKTIRKELEKSYGSEFSDYLKFVEHIRKQAMKKIADRRKRERFLKSLGSEDIVGILRKRGVNAATNKIRRELSRTSTD